MPSNTALAVGANIDYVLIKTQNQYTKQSVTVVLAESLLASVVGKNEYELLAKFSGKDMEGIEYEQLFDWVNPILAGSKLSAFRVICGDFVTTEDGTKLMVGTSIYFISSAGRLWQKAFTSFTKTTDRKSVV